MWLVGLWIIVIPWAPLWAILAGMLQFIPNFGVLLSLIGPALLGAFSENHMRFFYVLGLFAVIMVADGLFLQPYMMKRTAKVPFWVALFAPIPRHRHSILGSAIAPPLLAVIYAFRRKSENTPGSGSAADRRYPRLRLRTAGGEGKRPLKARNVQKNKGLK